MSQNPLEFKCQNFGIDKLKKSPLETCLLLFVEKIVKNQTKKFSIKKQKVISKLLDLSIDEVTEYKIK